MRAIASTIPNAVRASDSGRVVLAANVTNTIASGRRYHSSARRCGCRRSGCGRAFFAVMSTPGWSQERGPDRLRVAPLRAAYAAPPSVTALYVRNVGRIGFASLRSALPMRPLPRQALLRSSPAHTTSGRIGFASSAYAAPPTAGPLALIFRRVSSSSNRRGSAVS